jgi:sulfoxide reductase heme-binding subunit YedZ
MKAGKNDFSQPIVFGLVVAALLLARVYWRFGQRPAGAPRVAG